MAQMKQSHFHEGIFSFSILMASQKAGKAVTPVKAGVQNYMNPRDPPFRGNESGTIWTFYEAIKFCA
jgi:hypothetical protein